MCQINYIKKTEKNKYKHLNYVEKLNKKGSEDKMLAVLDMIEKENQMYINKGKIEGAKENSIEIAKKMLNAKMPIKSVMKFTGLSENQLKKLAK